MTAARRARRPERFRSRSRISDRRAAGRGIRGQRTDARIDRRGWSRSRSRLFDPPRRQHVSDARPYVVRTAAEEIGVAGECLIEEALLLERLAEDHAEHAAMAGIGHRL